MILFADDTSLISKSNSIDQLNKDMTNSLLIIQDWLKANKLTLNIIKTKLIHFNKGKTSNDNSKPTLHIDNIDIENASSLKFLGVYIDHKLSWKTHIDYISNKLLKIIYIIKTIKNIVSTTILRSIYTSLIQPQLMYGIITWFEPNNNKTKRLKLLQKKLIRLITKSRYNTHTSNLFKKLNLLNIDDIYKKQALLMYWKYNKNVIPPNLKTNIFTTHDIHKKNTRQANSIHLNQITNNIQKQSLNYKLFKIESETPTELLDLIKTSKFQTAKHIIKTYLLKSYTHTCLNINCYSCSSRT